jgi:peptide/nickel transport system permease protein
MSNPWLRFALRRLVSLVLVLLGLVTVTFVLVRLVPGNPAEILAGLNQTHSTVAVIRHNLGLDRPALSQYLSYIWGAVHGELGRSFYTSQTVGSLILQRGGSSAQLAGTALVLVMVVSIPGGMIAAALTRDGRRRRFEGAFSAVTSVFGAIPEFLMATLLAFVFAVALHIFPVAGSSGLQSLVLPVLAISLRPVAVLLRLVRVEALNVLSQDYIRTARSKRLSWWVIYLRHVLPNALTPALTIGGVLFSSLIAGAVVVENVFARNGLGTALVSAVLGRDYPVVQGIVLVLGVTVVFVNAVVDVLLVLTDPRSLTGQA